MRIFKLLILSAVVCAVAVAFALVSVRGARIPLLSACEAEIIDRLALRGSYQRDSVVGPDVQRATLADHMGWNQSSKQRADAERAQALPEFARLQDLRRAQFDLMADPVVHSLWVRYTGDLPDIGLVSTAAHCTVTAPRGQSLRRDYIYQNLRVNGLTATEYVLR